MTLLKRRIMKFDFRGDLTVAISIKIDANSQLVAEEFVNGVGGGSGGWGRIFDLDTGNAITTTYRLGHPVLRPLLEGASHE